MRSLTVKLALAFVVVSVVGIGVAALFVQTATQNNFQNVVTSRAESDFMTLVEGYYQQTGGWNGVNAYVHQTQNQQADLGGLGGRTGAGGNPAQQGSNQPPAFILLNQQNIVVVAGPTHQLGETVTNLAQAQARRWRSMGRWWGMCSPTARRRSASRSSNSSLRHSRRCCWGCSSRC